jgi:hypothetical protein
MDVRVQKDEAEVAAQMLQQRFYTAWFVSFVSHAQTETLESAFDILEKLGKAKLAVQVRLSGGKIPDRDRRLWSVDLNQEDGFAGLAMEVSRQRAGDEPIRQ